MRVEIKDDTDVYLVDTYGESKMFYALSKVVFLGGSLVPRGGQNPLDFDPRAPWGANMAPRPLPAWI